MPNSGRPTEYKPEYSELAHNYCLLGATNEALAGFFGVTSRTVDNWIAVHPEFRQGDRDGARRGRRRDRPLAVRPRQGLQPRGRAQDALPGRGAHGHQHGVLSDRHPGLRVLAAQPAAPILEPEAEASPAAGDDDQVAALDAAGERMRHAGRE